MTEYSAFFYGTLMAPQVRNRVIYGMPVSKHHVDNIKSQPAILHNHRRHRVRGADYPAVVAAADGSSVRGTYVTGLTDANVYKLDQFEGSCYERRVVRPRLLQAAGDSATGEGNVEGEEVETETYIWIAGEGALEDKEWDYAEFEREKLRFWASGHVDGEFEHEFDGADGTDKAAEASHTNGTESNNETQNSAAGLDKATKSEKEEQVEQALESAV